MNNKNHKFTIKEKAIKKIQENPDVDLSKEFLNSKDIETILGAIDNPRDKLLVSLLWETGGRISEIYDLSLKDIEEQKDIKYIILNGMTGKRKIPIFKSISLLENWLSEHPKKKNPNSSLWINPDGEKITYNQIRKIIQTATDEAGIQKITNPQHFRRSRAAYLSKILSQKQVRNWFGWTEESNLDALENDCSDCSGCPFSCGLK